MKKTIKAPRFDIVAIFIQIWKGYGFIFSDFETARAKAMGRPRIPPRRVFRAIAFILWSGGSWRTLPGAMGRRSTIHSYFLEWTQAGLFRKLWETIALTAAEQGLIQPDLQIIDGTHILSIYMPNHLTGFSYKHKSKRGIKLSILIDKQGIPVSLSIEAANVHDSQLLEGTLSHSVIEEIEPSDKLLLGDSGYVGEDQENDAEDLGFTPNFRPRKDQMGDYSKRELNQNRKHRWKVELSISWIKSMRRIRTCYERSIETFLGFCQLCCAYIVFRKCFI